MSKASAALAVMLALLAACVSGRSLRAQDLTPVVTVTLDRSRVTVGDPIGLTVVVRHAPDVQIRTTSIDDQLGDLEPLSSEPPQDRAVNGAQELRLQYRVAAYHTGVVNLPQLTFTYTLPDGSSGQVQSKGPQPITVQSVLPAGATPTEIQGLKPQVSLPIPASQQLIWLAGIAGIAAALALVAAGGVWLWRRHGRVAPLPAPSQAALARRELDRIMALGLVPKGELADHYRLIAVCIRRYLTERFGFPAVALTSGELSGRMETFGVERWPARLISGLLSECDAVAYARYVPAPPRIEADTAMAYEIIDATEGLTAARQPAEAV
ncbi:MAG TPA: hypothetical protein VKV26_22035 [Dehalococcoidia bacterium]|nr:hypothetical protein [Dehalococcoidia bacterium]